jgi:serine/threonine protein kinase
MSPEQAKAGNNSSDNYNASHSDIWSSGVVLFVMLLGFFPFEVKVDNDTPLDDFQQQLRQVWSQHQDEQWYKTKHVAASWALLSAPCQDLLKRIFEYNEDKRISLEEIKAHPWFNQKLPSKYAKELLNLDKMRKAKEEEFGASKDPILIRNRAKRLRAIVQAAAYPSESEEAMKILESEVSADDEALTWVKEAALHPLIKKVSLTSRPVGSWKSSADGDSSRSLSMEKPTSAVGKKASGGLETMCELGEIELIDK